MKRKCSVTKNIRIEKGTVEDYKALSMFHYRSNGLRAPVAIFSMKRKNEVAGVIVYSMPTTGCQMRKCWAKNLYGMGKKAMLTVINKNVRRISRVIIEPRFRQLGLASRLVAETMPKLNMPLIESMAVMGKINPFFEKAGMKGFTRPTASHVVQMIEALGVVGIEEENVVDPEFVCQVIKELNKTKTEFIKKQIDDFVVNYGYKATLLKGDKKIEFAMSRLTDRSVYYIWFNPAYKEFRL